MCAVGIGDCYLDEGKFVDARKSFEAILPLARKNAASGTAEARRDLAALYDRFGDVQVNQDKPTVALVFYKQSLAISQELARNQGDAQAQHDLLTSWDRVGNIYLSNGDARGALSSFAQALPLAQNLARDSDNLEAQQSLLDCHVEIGDVQLQLGNLTIAYSAYQSALRQFKQIAARWPKDAHSRSQAASAYGQLAFLNLQFHRPRDAITAANQGLSLAPDQKAIVVNLIEANVFAGQLPKAQALYLQNRTAKIQDVPFKQALLTDLEQLATLGLTDPDLIKLRDWVLKN